MKNLIRHSVIFLTFLILFSSKSIAADRILPLPKPSVDQETKAITAKKKEIYPQKKPKIEGVKETIDTSKTTSEISEVKEQEMFKEDNLEEDFEIPAFLRRQKD